MRSAGILIVFSAGVRAVGGAGDIAATGAPADASTAGAPPRSTWTPAVPRKAATAKAAKAPSTPVAPTCLPRILMLTLTCGSPFTRAPRRRMMTGPAAFPSEHLSIAPGS
jgi:hypothetical protein